MKLAGLGIMLFAFLASFGCHSESNSEQTPAPHAKKAPLPKKQEPVDPLANMAQAVNSGKPGAAVDLRYDIQGKPQVGVPVEIELALVPQVDAESMNVHIGGMDGLALSGDLDPTTTAPKFQEAVKYRFTATPAREGVFYATVTANLVHNGVAMSRTFSVPMVVGAASAAQKPAATPKHDAAGQPIQSMPAEEKKH